MRRNAPCACGCSRAAHRLTRPRPDCRDCGCLRYRRSAPCRCGHGRDAHRHYRARSDCGTCGRGACPAYRPYRARWWQLWRPEPELGPMTDCDRKILEPTQPWEME